MTGFGILSYAAAALGFLLLTILLGTSWRGRGPGVHLIVASGVTAAWAGVLATESYFGGMPFLLLYLLEIARDVAWLFALIAVAGVAAPRLLVKSARALAYILLLAPLPFFLLIGRNVLDIEPALLLSRAGLALSLVALVLLEQIYRNSPLAARRTLKYFTIGVGMLFAYDLFLYSQTELLRGVSIDAWNARGILNAMAVPMIAIAARRNPHWALEIFVSRQVVFYSTTFIAVGVYLVVMAIGGYYVRQIGGSWGDLGQIIFFAGAIVVLATLLASSTLRRYARVFISKHFYRNKYDYRVEWLRFIKTLSSKEEGDVRCTAVRAIAQVFSSPGGLLLLRDDSNGRYVPHAGWPMRVEAVPGVASVTGDEDLPRFLERTGWIVDTREYRATPDVYGNIELPQWLRESEKLRIVCPLLHLDQLIGFVVLYDPPPPFELTYEDRDLMKTLGRHVATQLAQHDADRKLAESRQFEAYNRLTAFMMHDLKNSIAQLKLIVANAERHKRNPEFIDDAIGTIANTAERMTRLIEQLRGSASPDRLVPVDVAAIAREAVSRCSQRQPCPVLEASGQVCVQADPERLTSIVEHVIRNAQDATPEKGSIRVSVATAGGQAQVIVEDTGSGMAPEFLRDRLFRPFDSTKGAKGMGIGAYQVREYVRQLGGNVEVQSSPGQGTRFAINLPLTQTAPRAAVAETV
ncbi:MAG TPA: XrtA/PEP-CTERM system histidine kinase PrsK [Steroidobacteraceae bacterium]|jgi:putative PEP-CTERM system histidine kinase